MALLLALLLQGLPADLLPVPRVLTSPEPSEYVASVRALAAEPEWAWERIEELRARSSPRREALALLVARSDAAQLRLIAVLGADCADDLADALLAAGTQTADEAVGVACLLAPVAPAAQWWPALAHVATRTAAPLPLRAAAVSRLLEAGCWDAWPLARSILRTGTARDEPAPWADWLRGGRYELSKRLIVAALDRSFAQAGAPPSGLEPNAAWKVQERSLEALEPRIQEIRARAPTAHPALSSPWQALLRHAASGDAHAHSAMLLLGRTAEPVLSAALRGQDPTLAEAARQMTAEAPR
jgi:hypothetical protein